MAIGSGRPSGFQGFDADALALLEQLPAWTSDQFAGAKATLTAGLMRPALALIEQVAGRLDPALIVVPRSSVSPLHADLRFAAPGTPRYKDYVMVTTWDGPDKRTAPTLWIRIGPGGVGFASGMALQGSLRDRFREDVAGPAGEGLAQDLERVVRGRGAEVAGEELKRVPAPYAQDHPRGDLLRKNALQVRFIEPLPPGVSSPGFADTCVERLGELMPVHRWLVANVAR
jgi:hypothetical protein